MSFNGSGTYTLPGAALNTGDTVSATENNTLRNDMATAFNKTLCRDGQAVPTANLPMGGFKHTGLAAGTTAGDSVRYEQLPSGSNVLVEGSGGTGTTVGYNGFKNRIINGAMMIDQRNAGASVTISDSGSGQYTLDRWRFYENTDGVITAQQSSTAPAGFKNSLLVTVTTTDSSIGSGQLAIFEQKIEGLNVSDFGWGTASAQAITVGFWVRSSVTGTYGGSVHNSGDTRSYPFSYTISSADTFEYKTITIAGDTSGTWLTTNGVGLILTFGLAVGSTFLGTANTWASANYQSVTGQTNLLGTSGATFYITGVQLEKGSTATSFDYRPYGTELALCQRYYEIGYVSGTGYSNNSNAMYFGAQYAVAKRATPTVTTAEYTYGVNTSNILTGNTNTVYTTTAAILIANGGTISGTGLVRMSNSFNASAEL